MYKLIIAEDEETIRRGLSQGFDWMQMGFDLCGLAADGEEALVLIEAHRPHALLTDIRMPGMDGLSLLEKALIIQPELKTVVLTGYAQFEYARRALTLHAHDFVLKMDIAVELEPAMQRLRTHLDETSRPVEDTAPGDMMDLEVVLRFIHERYAQSITLEEAAGLCYKSPSYFSRYFKKMTGKGFHAYVRDCRLEGAYRLLLGTGMRVSEVACYVGYTDPRHFSNLFQQKYGLLPSDVKK